MKAFSIVMLSCCLAFFSVAADRQTPVVTLVTAMPGDIDLVACAQNRMKIQQIAIHIRDNNPGLLKITDPDNYALINMGEDAEMNSSSCTTLSGDDRHIPLLNLKLSGTQDSPRITFDLPDTLADGHYALMVCDGITDAAGNALDGQKDGLPGGHHLQTFRVSQHNLFDNAHFDHCGASATTEYPWFIQGDNFSSHVVTTTPDAMHSTLSGAIFMGNAQGFSTSISQCVELNDSPSYQFSVNALNVSGYNPTLTLSCQFSNASGCGGFGQTINRSFNMTSAQADWSTYSKQYQAPTGAQSANCRVELSSNQGFATYLDDVLFISANGVTELIFANSFER